jgi:hypothetical protein
MYLYNILCIIYSDVITFNRAFIHYKSCSHHQEKPNGLCYISFINVEAVWRIVHASSFIEIDDNDVA